MCDCPTPEAHEAAVRADRRYRCKLIIDGSVRPLSLRPTLWLLPEERQAFEAQAKARLERGDVWGER